MKPIIDPGVASNAHSDSNATLRSPAASGATAKNGDEWTGEQPEDGWWKYTDKGGLIYESREVPAYRIIMDRARIISVNGQPSITPIPQDEPCEICGCPTIYTTVRVCDGCFNHPLLSK